jgi:hypothetical protein
MKTYIIVLSAIILLTSCTLTKTDDAAIPQSSQRIQSTDINLSEGAKAVDPTTVDSNSLTSPSSTGSTSRPR